jgi:hypothetical protein
MSKPTSLMVRAKYSSSVSGYTAVTVVPGKGRATASATSCAHQALTRAAAKGLGVAEDQVLLFELGTDVPVPWERWVGPEWVTFDARVKGSTTQLNLLPGGAA